MTSRSAVADYLAASLVGGNRKKAISEVAAWLKKNNKTRQADYLVQDVASSLSNSGYMFVRFITARSINPKTKAYLESFIAKLTGAKTVECEFIIDQKLIGGVVIKAPQGTLDASVRSQLSKIVEGVDR